MKKINYEELEKYEPQELTDLIKTAYQVISDKRLTIARSKVRSVKVGDHVTLSIQKWAEKTFEVTNVGRTRVKVKDQEAGTELIVSLAFVNL